MKSMNAVMSAALVVLSMTVEALSFEGVAAEVHDEVPLTYVTALDQSPNPEWLFAKPGDLRFADGISFDFRVDDPTAFDMFKISFRTGKGRYHGVFEPGEPGRWNSVIVRKSDCGDTEGDVAGWGNVKGVTIGGQFGASKTAKFRIANVRVLERRPEILVVRGDSAREAFRWNRHDRSACSMTKFLCDMGASAVQVSDVELARGIPASVRLVVLPSNPSVPAKASEELGRFAARGGRLFATFYLDSSVRKLLGVKTKNFYDRREDAGQPPIDGLVSTAEALADAPAFVPHRFNTIIEPVAGSDVRPLALFADARRQPVGIVALAQVPGGFFFSTGWNCWGREARQLFRTVLLAVEPSWRETLERGSAAADRDDAAVDAWLKSLKPKTPERRILSCHNEKGYLGRGWNASVSIARRGGYNEMMPNVAWGNCLFRNEAKECLDACRAQGMKCCFWKVCWRRTGKSKAEFPGRVMKDIFGKEDRSWMCPSDPANRAAEAAQFLELARMRPESIMYDYIRYPGGWWCACDGCRALFETKCGFTITDWNRQVRNDEKVWAQWFEFRRELLTSFVREVSRRVRAECPGVKLLAATYRDPDSARSWFGQDWVEWCREGLIDYSLPMNYYQGNVAGLRQLLVRQQKVAGGLKGKLLPILGMSEWPRTGRDAERMAQEIGLVRELGFDGFGLFELDDRCIESMPDLSCGILSK